MVSRIGRWFKGPENSDNKITTSQDLQAWIDRIAWSAAGIHVTHAEAMKCPAVKVSIKVLSESVAQLPFHIYRELDNNGREIARNNPVHRLLSTRGRPNSWQSSFEFRKQMIRHVALCGNAYAYKETLGNRLVSLRVLKPQRMRVEEAPDGSPLYLYQRPTAAELRYTPRDIFHLRGDCEDGFVGIDPIKENADPIALALAQDRFAALMFGNGVRNSGVLEVPSHLNEEAFRRLKEHFTEQYVGLGNAQKPIILEGGTKWSTTSMTSEEAQMLDSRKFQRSIVASLYRIPPHMVGDLEKATFSNIENLARQFVDYALQPWVCLFEQAVNTQLLAEGPNAGSVYAKLNLGGLLRGDAKTRAEVYRAGRETGQLNPNEIREMEDMPPRTDPGGEEYVRPANMESANQPRRADENAERETENEE